MASQMKKSTSVLLLVALIGTILVIFFPLCRANLLSNLPDVTQSPVIPTQTVASPNSLAGPYEDDFSADSGLWTLL
jgi:hypothetical protein